MKADRRTARRQQIETAAQEVLVERGYNGASMLEVAKRAKASNETLYRWYGDKNGLFAEIVRSNATDGLRVLDAALSEQGDVAPRLRAFGKALLTGILSDSAIELNRAAAADPSGTLGKTIARHGRDAVMPLLTQVLATAELTALFDSPEDAAETFIALLVGDLQTRRIVGVLDAPAPAYLSARADRAVTRFLTLAVG